MHKALARSANRILESASTLDVLIESQYKKRKWLFILLPIVMILMWNGPYVLSWGQINLAPEDQDYFFQAYEAIRKTIIDYHQFPWMNAWVGGGVPLFANPQVGVFSLQTLLVLLFGTVPGLKLSVVVYVIIGFFGAEVLFRKNFKASHLMSNLLAFCWIANGFFVAHLPGHYTFVFFALFPFALYLQLNILKRRFYIYYGLLLAGIALSAIHYALLQMLLILAIVGLAQLVVSVKNRDLLKAYTVKFIEVGALFLSISGIRIVYTLQYVLEYPRSFTEPTNQLQTIFYGLFTPGAQANIVSGNLLAGLPYSRTEYSSYVGIFIGLAVFCSIAWLTKSAYRLFRKLNYVKLTKPHLVILGSFYIAGNRNL